MRKAALGALALAILAGLAGPASRAQEPPAVDALPDLSVRVHSHNARVRELPDPEEILGTDGEIAVAAVLSAIEYGRPVRARELAEALLADDADSPFAHYAMAAVMHMAEVNHARALYHYERSVEGFEERHPGIDESTPWATHQAALQGSATVLISMGRHDRALEIFDQLASTYGGDWRSARAWPLSRAGRQGEARALAEGLLAESEYPRDRAVAWTLLCVLAAEARDTGASFDACMNALREEGETQQPDPVRGTNAAEAALGVFRLDEAERLLLAATQGFQRYTLASPWAELVLLYVAQGRTGEAVAASREMVAWRDAQQPEVRTHIWTSLDLSSAALLLAAGRPVDATGFTRRALARPDREGRHSAANQDLATVVSLLDHTVHRAAAEVLAEEASAAAFPESAWLWLDHFRFRLRAWLSGRRAAALAADEQLLSNRLQARPPGFARSPEWIDPDLVPLVGAGVMSIALDDARARGLVDDAHGYAQVFAAEIASRRGEFDEARRIADEAWDRLPRTEVLLRARVAAVAADAALRAGDVALALERFDRVFQFDPGTLRRLGVSLPCRVEASAGRVSAEAYRRLRSSPRFSEADHGFTLRLEGSDASGTACLEGTRGTLHACVDVTLRAGESPEDLGRRLALELQRAAFAPRVDLTQADLRSLDGSPVNAGDERLRVVLSDLIRPSEAAAE